MRVCVRVCMCVCVYVCVCVCVLETDQGKLLVAVCVGLLKNVPEPTAALRVLVVLNVCQRVLPEQARNAGESTSRHAQHTIKGDSAKMVELARGEGHGGEG